MKWFFSVFVLLASTVVQANSLDWKGGYRFEFVQVDKPSLANPSLRKSYGLNYLYLAPRIVASDGVNIVSRLNIFVIPCVRNFNIYPRMFGQLNKI